jgi:hypothetical protein
MEIWRREATRMGRTERGDKECAAKDMGQGIKDNSRVVDGGRVRASLGGTFTF